MLITVKCIYADIYQLHRHFLHVFRDYFSRSLSVWCSNVIAEDVRKCGCECDVVVTMNGEADCSMGDSTKSTIPHPSIPCILYFDTFNLFFCLHQSVPSSLLWILLLSFMGFYWFLLSVLLKSQHSRFSCKSHETGSRETGLFVGW